MSEFHEPNWRDLAVDADGTVGQVPQLKPRVMSQQEILHRFLKLEKVAHTMAGTLNVLRSYAKLSGNKTEDVSEKLKAWLPVIEIAMEKWHEYTRAYEEIK